MSFPIDITIPAANNDPADDQPIIKQNFANIAGYLGIDHIAPGTIGDGFHKQITFFTENIPGPVTDPASVSFTANAVNLGAIVVQSQTTVAQAFYKNNNGIFPQSAVRAFASFRGVAGTVDIRQSFNISSIAMNTAQTIITINIVSGATNGTRFVFIPSPFPVGSASLSISKTANTVTITISPGLGPNFVVDFVIIQV